MAVAVRLQHRLYRQPELRAEPLRGRRLALHALGGGLAGGVGAGLAFRPGFPGGVQASVLVTLAVLVLVVASSTDFHRRLIPDRLSYPAIVGAAVATPLWPEQGVGELWLGGGVALAIGVLLLLAGTAVGARLGVAETPFGLGDVKLILFIGLAAGWPDVLSALLVGAVAAGFPAFALLLARRSRTVFSYGPYLALGGALVLLFPSAGG